MLEATPLIFEPYLKSVIWGGDKICRYKGVAQPEPRIGESWEISAVPGHESVVASGPYAGLKLSELTERFGADLLGEKVEKIYGRQFPLLVKIIDAVDNLSVQVHPNGELARQRHGSLGKSEMWYIIDTEEGSKIYAGLKEEMTPDEYVRRVENGTFSDALAVYDSSAGDVFYIPAGCVHAIGAGNFLAEIQESSDISYRIYDYDRKDANGVGRELHTMLAKDAIDFTVRNDYRYPRPSAHDKDCEIVACDYFSTRRIIVDGRVDLSFDNKSFVVIMCVEGEVTLSYPSGEMTLRSKHTCLIPAIMPSVRIDGNATLLLTHI